jgi:hypothetical protein
MSMNYTAFGRGTKAGGIRTLPISGVPTRPLWNGLPGDYNSTSRGDMATTTT